MSTFWSASIRLSILFILCIFFSQQRILASDSNAFGYPYIQNYSKQLYHAGNQNWSVARGKDGVMYYGNSNGLLAFDGSAWSLYKMPDKQIVRAVATDEQGRVYVGGFGEMGYWQYDNTGRFRFKSLVGLMPEQQRPKGEIWKIYTTDNAVYFQSFSTIYIYREGKMKLVKAEQPFLFLLNAGKRYFAEVISKGLYELKGDSLHYLENSEKLGNSGVLTILPYKGDSLLVGTAKNGVFVYDGKDFAPWKNEAELYFRKYQLNNGVQLKDGFYAFGTILNGIFILDQQGKLLHRINKRNGLQNNTVLNLFSDKSQNLWVGLDNGIDRIEVNSPLYFYLDKTGTFGTVYASIIHNDKIYLGTNQGLFYSDWNKVGTHTSDNLNFQMIDNSQGQVWSLDVIDGELLCGHNEGTFRVEGGRLYKISDMKGGWTIQRYMPDPSKLIQGTYTGLAVYQKGASGRWEFSHKINGFGEPSKNIEQDNSGNIWVSHAYKGLFRVNLTGDLKEISVVQSFDKTHGLPHNNNLSISRLYNRLLFSSDAGFYVYDELNGRFIPYKELNNRVGGWSTSSKIIPASHKKYWFINHGKVALADLSNPKQPVINAKQFSILDGRMVQEYESINRISDAIYLISVDEGFVIYNTASKPVSSAKLPQVLIRKVDNTTDKQRILSETGRRGKILELPYTLNNLRFTFALPYYKQALVQYQYYLEGYSEHWSPWSSSLQKEFTNLAQGNYVFKVRAQVNGDTVTEATTFRFTVLPPWYATWWAYLIYCVIAVVGLWLGRLLYQRKLALDKRRIQARLEQEKQEQLKQEALLNEKKIMALRNEQLKSELSSKSRELANTALSIVTKNELLQNISHELNKLEGADGNRVPEKQLKKIQKVISDGMGSHNDWELFERSFNETNANYFKKLKEGYPELTPNDLKLCAYLRMNMCSKEIASLLNITVRGVELRRYRLRKKLNMDPEKNLVEFVMEI